MEVKSLEGPPGVPEPFRVDLDERAIALQERARRFCEGTLIPLEEEAERGGGRLPDDVVAAVKREAIDGGERLPTLFVVDRDRPGVEIVSDPAFTHSYPEGHPTIRFRDVELAEEDVIGGIGRGDELQRSWFTEERLGIAARCGGAMWRLLDETVAWSLEREQGGSRIYDHQGVSFPLADSAADAAAGRLLTLTVASL